MTACFDVQPAAHCDFLPAPELSVQQSFGSDVWRCLTLPSIVLLLKALRLCFTVGRVLFLRLKGGCPRGFTAQGLNLVKELLCNGASLTWAFFSPYFLDYRIFSINFYISLFLRGKKKQAASCNCRGENFVCNFSKKSCSTLSIRPQGLERVSHHCLPPSN